MAFILAKFLRAAGSFMLRLLKEEAPVRYSHFYDRTEATHDKLVRSLGLDEDTSPPVESLVDTAISEFEKVSS